MAIPKNDKKFISLFIVLISLFIFVFFTKSYYWDLMMTVENYENSVSKKDSLDKELRELNCRSKRFKKIQWGESTGTWKTSTQAGCGWGNKSGKEISDSDIKKYLHDISEDRLVELFYKYANDYNNWTLDDDLIEKGQNSDHRGTLKILSLNMSQAQKNEIGFDEVNIQLTVRVSDENDMRDFLNFIINDNDQYQFFINSFTVPKQLEGWFNITIPMTVLYKYIAPKVKKKKETVNTKEKKLEWEKSK